MLIGWVPLNSVSKKLFEFNSNVFRHFKVHFFKVLATNVMADGMPLMLNRDGEPCFPFYWFKSYDDDLLTLVGLIGATLPPSVAAPFIGENGQPAREVGPAAVAVEVSLAAIKVIVLATHVESVVVSSSIVAASLLSVGVVITSAPTVPPASSSAPMVFLAVVLVVMALPSSSSCPSISLDHLYTSSDIDTLWGEIRQVEGYYSDSMRPKVANATVAFVEAVTSNRQLASKAKKMDLGGKVESMAGWKASKELEGELILYKKEVMKRHEKGFQKDGFFAKDLELGLFNPFKDVKEGVLLDEKEIDAEEEVAAEG
ncbi:hypothetical protein HKD37_01G000489 [Glycine soja]